MVTTGRPARRDGARTACRGSSTPAATTPSAARRADGTPGGRRPAPRPDTFYGVAKVAAEALLQPVRRPLRHRRGRAADRLLPAGAGDHPQPVHLALPRRLRADGRGGADHPRPGLRGALRHLREHPRAGGTSSRAGRWATTRRTTPRCTPTRWPGTTGATRSRAPTSAAPTSSSSCTARRWTAPPTRTSPFGPFLTRNEQEAASPAETVEDSSGRQEGTGDFHGARGPARACADRAGRRAEDHGGDSPVGPVRAAVPQRVRDRGGQRGALRAVAGRRGGSARPAGWSATSSS